MNERLRVEQNPARSPTASPTPSTPLRVRLLVEHGRFPEALEGCSDGLALVGDLLWLEEPEASLGALGQSTGLVQPCADAVWKTADEALVTAFVTELEQVGRDAPPSARVVQLERVAQGVRMFGAFFTADQVARLPVGAGSMVSSFAPSRLERVGLAHWWSSCDRAFLGLIAAADLPAPARGPRSGARSSFRFPDVESLRSAQRSLDEHLEWVPRLEDRLLGFFADGDRVEREHQRHPRQVDAKVPSRDERRQGHRDELVEAVTLRPDGASTAPSEEHLFGPLPSTGVAPYRAVERGVIRSRDRRDHVEQALLLCHFIQSPGSPKRLGLCTKG